MERSISGPGCRIGGLLLLGVWESRIAFWRLWLPAWLGWWKQYSSTQAARLLQFDLQHFHGSGRVGPSPVLRHLALHGAIFPRPSLHKLSRAKSFPSL